MVGSGAGTAAGGRTPEHLDRLNRWRANGGLTREQARGSRWRGSTRARTVIVKVACDVVLSLFGHDESLAGFASQAAARFWSWSTNQGARCCSGLPCKLAVDDVPSYPHTLPSDLEGGAWLVCVVPGRVARRPFSSTAPQGTARVGSAHAAGKFPSS